MKRYFISMGEWSDYGVHSHIDLPDEVDVDALYVEAYSKRKRWGAYDGYSLLKHFEDACLAHGGVVVECTEIAFYSQVHKPDVWANDRK